MQPEPPDFTIHASLSVSVQFLNRNISTFGKAAEFISGLPYGRNSNKEDLLTVFSDGCGTCSTKHALLKKLAEENDFAGLQLIMGIYRMNGSNTPPVSARLLQNGLEHIPEAHCYLKYQGRIYDYTSLSPSDFEKDLLKELEIAPDQITAYKVAYHKNFLASWMKENKIPFTHDDIWNIREQCIQDLSSTEDSKI